ncbi:MAG TPA: BTAD domain-containing putative transcriptional regulator, partial [Asanoa sp.]|nr:BTAD domain-containing putative transcriptional regulator [Asanoa sp.]
RTPGQLLALTEAGYLARVPDNGLDIDLFNDCVRAARASQAAGRLDEAAAGLRAGLALWRAEALAGLSGGYFAAARDRLGDARCAAYETLAEIELARGRHASVVPELVRLVGEFPLRERLRYQLILALYRSGRQAEALAAFRAARQFLAGEFGVEPGNELQDLHRRMLRSDPALVGSPRPAEPAPHPHPRLPVALPLPLPAVMPLAPAPGHRAWRWGDSPPNWVRVCAVLVTLAGAGLVTWLVIGAYAVNRRSRILGAIAAAYLGLGAVSCAIVDATVDDPNSGGYAIGMWFFAWFGGAVHVAVLNFLPKRASSVDVERRVKREQALQLLRHHPTLAHQLGIGRPDLPGHFDDGGLVDVNAVPEVVLAALPGLGQQRAWVIAADRARRGPFTTVDDLAARGLVAPHDLEPLREIIICGQTFSGDGVDPVPGRSTLA